MSYFTSNRVSNCLKMPESGRSQNQRSEGFSLVELMIVMAIVAILASLSIPSYMTYTRKAKMAEVITLFDSATHGIVEAYQATGRCPATLTIAGTVLQGNSIHNTPTAGPSSIKEFWYNGCANTAYHPCTCQVAAYVSDDLGGGAVSLVMIAQPDGGMRKLCGSWGSWELGTVTPLYLPSTCNSVDIYYTP